MLLRRRLLLTLRQRYSSSRYDEPTRVDAEAYHYSAEADALILVMMGARHFIKLARRRRSIIDRRAR